MGSLTPTGMLELRCSKLTQRRPKLKLALETSLRPVRVSQRKTRATPRFSLFEQCLGTEVSLAQWKEHGKQSSSVSTIPSNCCFPGEPKGQALELDCLGSDFFSSLSEFVSSHNLLVAQFPHLLNGNNNGSYRSL